MHMHSIESQPAHGPVLKCCLFFGFKMHSNLGSKEFVSSSFSKFISFIFKSNTHSLPTSRAPAMTTAVCRVLGERAKCFDAFQFLNQFIADYLPRTLRVLRHILNILWRATSHRARNKHDFHLIGAETRQNERRDPKLKDKYEIWQQKLRCFVRHRMNYAHRGSVERWRRRRRQRQGIKLQTINTICTWPLSISIAVRLKHLFVHFISSSVCILRRCASITCIVCVYVRGLRFSVQIYFTLTRKWSVSFALPRSVIPCTFFLTHSLALFGLLRFQLWMQRRSVHQNWREICICKYSNCIRMKRIARLFTHRDSWQASGVDCDRKKEDESVCADKTEKIVCMPNDNNANSLFFCCRCCCPSNFVVILKGSFPLSEWKMGCVCAFVASEMVLQIIEYALQIVLIVSAVDNKRNVDQMKLNGTEAFYWACNARRNGQRAMDGHSASRVCVLCAVHEVCN